MSILGRLWLAPARARHRYLWLRRRLHGRDWLVRRYAPGRTFADIGCMYGVHGANAFLAEESGATEVTAVDLIAPTPEYEAEHARRDSKVRFVYGDLRDPAVIETVGRHDVVWCTGILCVDAHPVATLEALRDMTREVLVVDASVIPEIPGVPHAAVFYPGLPERARRVYSPTGAGDRKGITRPFDPRDPDGSWWWGPSRSAFRALLEAVGLEVVEWIDQGHLVTVVARRAPGFE